MIFRRWALAGALAFAANLGAIAYAETPEAETPSPDCVAADAAVTTKLRPVLMQQVAVNLPVGDVMASLFKARALCREGAPDRGMLVYIRISDALTNALAIASRGAR